VKDKKLRVNSTKIADEKTCSNVVSKRSSRNVEDGVLTEFDIRAVQFYENIKNNTKMNNKL